MGSSMCVVFQCARDCVWCETPAGWHTVCGGLESPGGAMRIMYCTLLSECMQEAASQITSLLDEHAWPQGAASASAAVFLQHTSHPQSGRLRSRYLLLSMHSPGASPMLLHQLPFIARWLLACCIGLHAALAQRTFNRQSEYLYPLTSAYNL